MPVQNQQFLALLLTIVGPNYRPYCWQLLVLIIDPIVDSEQLFTHLHLLCDALSHLSIFTVELQLLLLLTLLWQSPCLYTSLWQCSWIFKIEKCKFNICCNVSKFYLMDKDNFMSLGRGCAFWCVFFAKLFFCEKRTTWSGWYLAERKAKMLNVINFPFW